MPLAKNINFRVPAGCRESSECGNRLLTLFFGFSAALAMMISVGATAISLVGRVTTR